MVSCMIQKVYKHNTAKIKNFSRYTHTFIISTNFSHNFLSRSIICLKHVLLRAHLNYIIQQSYYKTLKEMNTDNADREVR